MHEKRLRGIDVIRRVVGPFTQYDRANKTSLHLICLILYPRIERSRCKLRLVELWYRALFLLDTDNSR